MTLRATGSSSTSVVAIDTNPERQVAFTGSFDSSIDFGIGPHTSAGTADVFVALLPP